MKIVTNNQPRDILTWYDLTPAERKEFDYLEDGEGSFFRYKGWVYDLGNAMRIEGVEDWHGYYSGTAFCGVLVKISSDCETVIVGSYFS